MIRAPRGVDLKGLHVEVEALLAGEGSTKISDKEAREIIGTRDALTLADELAATRVVC